MPEDQEGLLHAEISLPMIAVAKSAADPVGHCALSEAPNVDVYPGRWVIDLPHRPV